MSDHNVDTDIPMYKDISVAPPNYIDSLFMYKLISMHGYSYVSLRSLVDEIQEWLDNTMHDTNEELYFWCDLGIMNYEIIYYRLFFKYEVDLLAFRMRFGIF